MADWDKQRVIAIGGPTASGKTAFSVAMAKQYNGEIICADSMQIYKDLSIGTAKVTSDEAQGIEHHLVDILEPQMQYSVADFVSDAGRAITEISQKGKLPIVVGGTGLYIESLLTGIRFQAQKPDPQLRAKLEAEAADKGPVAMHGQLEKIDPEYAKSVHPNNVGRVIRALELYYLSGITMTEQRKKSMPVSAPYNSLVICLEWPREALYQRIDRRVDIMVEQGVLEEAKLVWQHKNEYITAAQAIGYKEFFPYFDGNETLESCIANLKKSSRNYAKRQLTWFRRMKNVVWIQADSGDLQKKAIGIIDAFLEQS